MNQGAPQPPAITDLCRDCLSTAAPGGACPSCGGARILHHPELGSLAIAHLDCDAFYASVEKRDNPSLLDKPVIIGGGKRGVVATACYVARTFGVRSAMPMFQALQRCPSAVVIPPDMAKYVAVGRQVRALMEELTPLVEPISIDEAFLDLSGTARLHRAPPAVMLAGLAKRVAGEIGITVSIGLSFNKFLAKIASEMEKPRGFSLIGEAEAANLLADKPVAIIFGVGKVMEKRLAADGIHTIADLRRVGDAELARRYGGMGTRLARLSRGEDDRPVEPRGEAKSIGSETTFETNVSDLESLRAVLRQMAERVSARLKEARLAGQTVTLKLKTADFRLRTRQRQLADPTLLADRIFHAADSLLSREVDGTSFRLAGISVSGFSDAAGADPDDLADPQFRHRAAAEKAMDSIRARFGERAVDLGLVFNRRRPAKPSPAPRKG